MKRRQAIYVNPLCSRRMTLSDHERPLEAQRMVTLSLSGARWGRGWGVGQTSGGREYVMASEAIYLQSAPASHSRCEIGSVGCSDRFLN